MNKISPKKLSTEINVPNKYKFILIKCPNGVITLCRSTYLNQDILNKLNTNPNINIQFEAKIDSINLDVDYTQHLLQNKDKKKRSLTGVKKSERSANLVKNFLS